MSTIADSGFPNLRNVTSRLTPAGSIEQAIAEVLTKQIDWLEDVPWSEGSEATGDLVTERTGLPSPKWRKLNQGIDPSKSETAQFTEACGMLEDYSKVDVDLADLHGNANSFRASEDKAFVEAFSEEVARAIFYESAVDNPEMIHGLSPRYAATSGYKASSYVLKGTNAGVNCHSVWLIDWNPDKISGLFGKGSKAGLVIQDLGQVLTNAPNAKEFLAYVTRFQWKCGIRVKDYRYAVRFQWDPDDAAFVASAKGLYLAMQDMLETIFKCSENARFYMNRTSMKLLRAQMASNDDNYLEYATLSGGGGRKLAHFLGVPVRVTDSLVAETAI